MEEVVVVPESCVCVKEGNEEEEEESIGSKKPGRWRCCIRNGSPTEKTIRTVSPLSTPVTAASFALGPPATPAMGVLSA